MGWLKAESSIKEQSTQKRNIYMYKQLNDSVVQTKENYRMTGIKVL